MIICCDPDNIVVSGWLVESHSHCTCGAGGVYGHEEYCGLVPLEPVDKKSSEKV